MLEVAERSASWSLFLLILAWFGCFARACLIKSRKGLSGLWRRRRSGFYFVVGIWRRRRYSSLAYLSCLGAFVMGLWSGLQRRKYPCSGIPLFIFSLNTSFGQELFANSIILTHLHHSTSTQSAPTSDSTLPAATHVQ